MIIYLIGFMGAGKSSTGKKLAEKLNFDFADLDTEIETKSGLSISTYFEQYGEAQFRTFEKSCLHQLSKGSSKVIATGGGTPCFFDNMEFMLRTGLTVYLKLSAASLSSRLKNSKDERPLISGMSDHERTKYIKSTLAAREVWYCKADITVKGEDLNLSEILEEIEKHRET